jgi:hypothetical protein
LVSKETVKISSSSDTYKREGDGFSTDAISKGRYTYLFYYRNMPAPKKFINKTFSPLHAIIPFFQAIERGQPHLQSQPLVKLHKVKKGSLC